MFASLTPLHLLSSLLDFPASTLDLLEVLLATKPELRGTASSALQSEFFTTNPLPCDPSTLPKYRPNKEFDVKLQNDESVTYFPAFGKVRENNSFIKLSRESSAILDPEFNAGLQPSIQNRQWQLNTKIFIEVDRPGCPTEPRKGMPRNVYSHSSLSMHSGNFGTSRIMDRNQIPSIKASARQFGAAELSRFSNSVAVRGHSRFHMTGPQWPEGHFKAGFSHLDNDQSFHCLSNKPNASHLLSKESAVKRYVPNENRIHCSGPLIPPGPGENLDEVMKEHERQMHPCSDYGVSISLWLYPRVGLSVYLPPKHPVGLTGMTVYFPCRGSCYCFIEESTGLIKDSPCFQYLPVTLADIIMTCNLYTGFEWGTVSDEAVDMSESPRITVPKATPLEVTPTPKLPSMLYT
ncbi:S-adenosyl-L-methionine-dependent methyltransferase mraW [Hibiscus syriacus]|uniref:S-adenosyl-L-methionine-dependent methyltransferase mraW n=1 Tax=Hibiscus syriacus TaxID=106335 RepID=A0A6A2WTL2_HIBSY|nr:S-adenosyl-L-methionine-dependent methyltransferase mraW [Hibiscus syriacus]